MNLPLSAYLNAVLIQELRTAIQRKKFPKVSFEHAMSFLLTDGILPASGLPAQSFLQLEDWVRAHNTATASFTATQLKNQTGLVLDAVREGKTVTITQHGRPFAEIRRVE